MDTKQYVRIHKALCNKNRLEIFYNILCYEHQGFETDIIQIIMQNLCIEAPTISHHLKKLSDAGLITLTKKGKYLETTVNKKTLEKIKRNLAYGEECGKHLRMLNSLQFNVYDYIYL